MRLVIVGAGTGVGKTHLGVALARALVAAGEEVAALKPIESGVTSAVVTDAELLQAAGSSRLSEMDPPPYRFAEPISPHLAARRAGVTIDLTRVEAWVDGCVAPWVLVETAGGLLSPLGMGVTNLDLARALRPDALILVTLDRLGVLHEVAACRLALRVLAPQVTEAVVVLQAPEQPDLSTSTNSDELVALGLAATAWSIPRGAAEAPEVQTAAGKLVEHLRGLRLSG